MDTSDDGTLRSAPQAATHDASQCGSHCASHAAAHEQAHRSADDSVQPVAEAGSATSAVGFDWSDDLVLGNPKIDGIHREFVEMMQALHRADDGRMLATVEAALEHTQAHFRHETTLMQLHEFPPIHCHDSEHASVLEVMIAVRDRVAAGEVHYGRVLAAAMMEWLHVHVPTMDAVLVAWLKERGIDESDPPSAEGVPAAPRAVAG